MLGRNAPEAIIKSPTVMVPKTDDDCARSPETVAEGPAPNAANGRTQNASVSTWAA